MKKVLIILLLHFPGLLISQEIEEEIKLLSNKIVPEFCGCLQEFDMLNGENFGDCFAINIQKYEQELSKFYIDDSTQVAEEKNDQFIFQLFSGMQEKLFNECEEYYLFIKNLRDTGLQNLMAIDVKKEMDSLNNLNSDEMDSDYHFRKGLLLFAEKQHPRAVEEILKALAEDPDNNSYRILLAWIYEEQNNSEEAIKIFDELILETGGIEFVMLKEFTKRNFRKIEKTVTDCLKFQTGKFKMVSAGGTRTVIIERFKDHQIETSLADNFVTKMSVEWLDNCNYNLKYLESTNPEMDHYIGTKLKIKILETTPDSFKFKATMEGVDYIMIEEMTMVN